MELMARGQPEKSQSKDFFKLLREVLRYQEWSGPSGLHKLAACAGLQPLGPQGLKPHRNTAFNAGLKRCSTQNQAPPKSKSTQYQVDSTPILIATREVICPRNSPQRRLALRTQLPHPKRALLVSDG